MRLGLARAAVIAVRAGVALPAAAQTPAPNPADAKTQIAAAVKSAAVDGIRVFVTWTTDSGDASARFAQALKSPVVTKTGFTSDEYRLVTISLGQLDRNLEVARAYGVPSAASAMPAVTVLDDKGKVVAQATSSEFTSADGVTFDPEKIAAFAVKHRAPVQDAPRLLEAAVKQAKQTDKVVFVWFSAPW
jgi:hypothetical protein